MDPNSSVAVVGGLLARAEVMGWEMSALPMLGRTFRTSDL